MRIVTFYLPQFHPIPENDALWEKDFTEWTLLQKARPLFPGHEQPHVPGELGMYDLRDPLIRNAQARLAEHYGIGAFCYYHYWFQGRRVLERPFQEVLASGTPNFPFCLCWANETWKRWCKDGTATTFIHQGYDPDDDRAHIRWLLQAFADERYLRVHDRPLFLIYRPFDLLDPLALTALWRRECRLAGMPEPYLCMVDMFRLDIDPRSLGFDARVLFTPHLHPASPKRPDVRDAGNYVVSTYADIVEQALRMQREVTHPMFPCVTLPFDNTARQTHGRCITVGGSPELYGQWLQKTVETVESSSDDDLVFVFAWNEWSECCHLEPDQRHGRAYLEATQHALAGMRVPALQL